MDASTGWDAVGTLIRHRREELGLSQGALARLLAEHLGESVTQTTVSANEHGQRWRDRPELLGAYVVVLDLDMMQTLSIAHGLNLSDSRQPTPVPPGHLYTIIQEYVDALPRALSEHETAELFGVTPTVLASWRQPTALIERAQLEAIARVTGNPYGDVLTAMLMDIDYADDPPPSSDETRTA